MIIDGIKYIREDSVSKKDGERHIVILDKGWIFEGILSKDNSNDMYILSDCSNIQSFKKVGIGGLLLSAKKAEAVLSKADEIKFRIGSEIFMSQTPVDWK